MGGTRVGPQAIREYLARMRERYEQARREEKGRSQPKTGPRPWRSSVIGGPDMDARGQTEAVRPSSGEIVTPTPGFDHEGTEP